MTSKLRQLGKDSIIYGLGSGAVRALSFLTLPIYTRVFSPVEYGALESVVLVSSLLAALLSMGMDSALSFFYTQHKEDSISEQRKWISAIMQWLVFWGALVLPLALLGIYLFRGYFLDEWVDFTFYVVAFFSTFCTLLYNQALNIFRLQYKAHMYTLYNIIRQVILLGVTLVMVLVLKWGLISMFIGQLIPGIVLLIPVWRAHGNLLDFRHRHTYLWKRLLRFGAPLFPQALVFYLVTASDRWLIKIFLGNEDLGFYSVALRFILIITLMIETFRQAWLPLALDSIKGDGDKPFLNLIFRGYYGLGISAVVLLATVSPWLLRLLTAPEFHHVYPLLGLLAWYPVFYGSYNIIALGFWKTERMHLGLYVNLIFVIIKLLLTVALIPVWGINGVALANGISAFCWALITVLWSERTWKVGFAWKPWAATLLASYVLVGSIIWLHIQGNYLVLVPLALVGSVAPVFLSMHKREREMLKSKIKIFR